MGIDTGDHRHVKWEAGTGVKGPPAEEHQGPLQAGGSKESYPLGAAEGAWPYSTATLGV